jgi:hypothetical protein
MKGLLQAVLALDLQLELVSPLAIRSGGTGIWTDHEEYDESRNKRRGGKEAYRHRVTGKSKGWSDLTEDYVHAEVRNERLQAVIQVPASSLRGALRSWALGQLVDYGTRKALVDRDDHEALKAGDPQLARVLDLFGHAGSDGSQAGRLQVETLPFNGVGCAIQVMENRAVLDEAHPGGWPDNAWRQIVQRGPLHPVLQSALEGGLHSRIEIQRGQSFAAKLLLRNPTNDDLRLLFGLLRDLEIGLARVGGLSSIGRGHLRPAVRTARLGLPGGQPLPDWAQRMVEVPASSPWSVFNLPVAELKARFENEEIAA